MVCIMRIATAHVDVLCFHTGIHGRGVCQGAPIFYLFQGVVQGDFGEAGNLPMVRIAARLL